MPTSDELPLYPAADRKGHPLVPGDIVRQPIYPRGTMTGVVVAHPRAYVVQAGREYQALSVLDDDGKMWSLSSKALKLG